MLCLVVPLLTTSPTAKFDLVFGAVPDGIKALQGGRIAPMANNDASSSNADPQHDRMGRITQSVKDPEGMSIPSFVRLEPTKERLNFFRQVAAVSFDPVFNVTGRLGDRKHRSFRAHFPRDNR